MKDNQRKAMFAKMQTERPSSRKFYPVRSESKLTDLRMWTDWAHKTYPKQKTIIVDEKMTWNRAIAEAKKDKAWANKTKDDKHWRNNASQVSLEMLHKRLNTPVEQLAKEKYQYWKMRQKAGYEPKYQAYGSYK